MPKITPFKKYHQKYEKWFVEHAPFYDAEVAAVRECISDGGMGLEVGVGSGLFSEPLGIPFGIDPCGEMLKMARERNIDVALGSAECLPCKSNKFDYILMVTVVCFFDDPGRAFREAKRVLVPGGKIVVAFIDQASPLGKEYERSQSESTFYRDARFQSSQKIIDILEEEGFKYFSFRQCLASRDRHGSKEIRVRPGYGKGGFVVLEARSENL